MHKLPDPFLRASILYQLYIDTPQLTSLEIQSIGWDGSGSTVSDS
jgi:hypothetical protein